MADLINATDSLNTGRFKINAIIEDASAAKTTADSVQTQLDTIILDSGTSDAEVVQSRVDKDGNPYQTLKSRLDSEKSIIDQSLVSLGSKLADIENTKAEQSALLVEKARIDSFTTLATGSTTGDAELIDGRVGADDTTYPNIGGAIRGQAVNLKKDITKLDNRFNVEYGANRYSPVDDVTGKYLGPNGELVSYDSWNTTGFIYVADLENVRGSALISGVRAQKDLNYIVTYDRNKNFIRQVGTTYSSWYTVEAGVAYIRFCYKPTTELDLMLTSGAITPYVAYSENVTLANSSYNTVTVSKDDFETPLADSFAYGDFEEVVLTFSNLDHYVGTDGVIVAYTDVDCTDYVACGDFVAIKLTNQSWSGSVALAFFDENKFKVSTFSSATPYIDALIEIPVNAKYFIVNDNRVKGGATYPIPSVKKLKNYTLVNNQGLKWAGNKWTVVGDSLTEVNIRTTKNYHDYIAEDTGITVVNMGVSGTGYARGLGTNSFYDRILNVPTDSDVVTLFGSGNDLGAGLPLGTETDTLASNTLCGYINATIDRLYSIMPTVNLGIITPTPWIGNPPSNQNGDMYKYSEKLVNICKNRGIPCLDLFHCSNLRPDDATFRTLAYSKDDGGGVHPDETGHMIIAPRFKGFLETLLF